MRFELHSSTAAAGWSGRFGKPQLLLTCDSQRHIAKLVSPGGIVQEWRDPLAALRWMARSPSGQAGRWIGYLSYDLGRWFETLPSKAQDDLHLPLFAFGFHTAEAGTASTPAANPSPPAELLERISPQVFLRDVQRVIDYIAAGDVFQVNLAHRIRARVGENTEAIWRRLLSESPAAYGALLQFFDHTLICNSPELFLRVDADAATGKRLVQTRPIKGTRPVGEGMEAALRESIKDQAELNMIVDLERNDLGRVCTIGSVRVIEPRTIETHPTVLHGVATIQGDLRSDVDFVDLLAATFPGGSITGAPKIRAMQIIDELEPCSRGPYCGSIGYVEPNGNLQFNIAIRTILLKDGIAHISVGGGIVADSQPQAEYAETLVKARALLSAIGLNDGSLAEI